MILIKTLLKQNILSVNDSLATLLDISESKIQYEFSFFVDVQKAIKSNAIKIVISILETKKQQNDEKKSLSNMDLISNILKQSPAIKDNITKNNNQNIIKKQNVDVSSGVNNEIVSSIMKGQTNRISSKQLILQKTSISAKGNTPVLSSNTFTTTNTTSNSPNVVKQNSLQMLIGGNDPSNVAGINSNLSSNQAIAGTNSQTNSSILKDESSAQAKYYTSLMSDNKNAISINNSKDFSEEILLPVLMNLVDSKIELTKKIDFELNNPSEFDIQIDLFDMQDFKIDSIKKTINHAQQFNLFRKPKIAPTAYIATINKLGTRFLSIKQNDPKAHSVRIYKKIVNFSNVNIQDYMFVNEVLVESKHGFVSVPVTIDSSSINIFRCISVGSGDILSDEYTNIVIKPIKILHYKPANKFARVSITTKTEISGIHVYVSGIPTGVNAIRILRKNKTLHEKEFSSVKNYESHIIVNENSLFPIVFIDTDVKRNYVYEYSCEFFFKTGEILSNIRSVLVEYIPIVDNLVQTIITNPVKSNEPLDFSFTIKSNLIEKGTEITKKILENANILEFFKDDIQNQKEFLQQLIAHKIVRINLNTGEIEDFGILTTELFSDSLIGKLNACKPIDFGNEYRYEVYALLRSAETLLEKLVKSTIKNGKEYFFKPAKFLHPLALLDGNITTEESRQTNHAKDEMTFGRVGNVISTSLVIPKLSSEITEISAVRINNTSVLLQWVLSNPSKNIDHFLIFRESLKNKNIIGKTHTISNSNKHEFLHVVNHDDIGLYNYSVMAIYNDYIPGIEIKANGVVL